MTPTEYRRLKEVFFNACELDPADRDSYLLEALGGDRSLLAEAKQLFRFNEGETLVGGLSDTALFAVKPTPPSGSAPIDWEGRMLGKYRVTRVLEAGGMGTVLEAEDSAIGRRVAIKVLHPELAADEAMCKRFVAEARAAGAINHPNVVTLYDVGEEGDFRYLVMEYAEDGSAEDQIQLTGAMPVERATDVILQACRGVAAAHAAGLIHRDLKPANLLLRNDGTVRVSDFGIAKLEGPNAQRLTLDGQILGTPNYMSPEQCQGGDIDARTDIYALGATYYTLLVGRMPYADRKNLVSLISAHCSAEPPDPRVYDKQIPAEAAQVIRRAMAKTLDERYQSVDELIADLDASERPAPPAPARRSSRRVVAAAALSALLLVAVSTWNLFGRGRDPAPPAPAPGGGAPAADAPPIRIGVLHSLTGTMARSEEVSVDACLLAIDQINKRGGVLGRKIEPVIADGASDGPTFGAEAVRLIDDEHVATIFGCCTSDSRKAVKTVVEEKNHLLVYPTNHEGLETSSNVIYMGGDPSQTLIPCARWSYAFGGKRRFFLVGSDYVFPRVANEILKDYLVSLGAEIVGEEYLPLGETNVSSLVQAVRDAEPDAIINTISGDSQTAFVRSLRGAGVEATQFTTGMGEQEVRNTSVRLMLDDFSVSTYFQSLPTPANQAFVKAFHDRYGQRRAINASMESSYVGVMMWAQAVEACGELDPPAILESYLKQSYQAPSGEVRIDARTHYAFRNSYLGKIQADGSFRIVWQSAGPVPPQPYPESRTPDAWQELLGQLQHEWGGGWAAPAQ